MNATASLDRIHQTPAMSFARSRYVASVATYSGGMPEGIAPENQSPENLFAALIFSGGASDNVFGLDFQAASERYRNTLATGGHFAAMCDHGLGHEIRRSTRRRADKFPSYCSR